VDTPPPAPPAEEMATHTPTPIPAEVIAKEIGVGQRIAVPLDVENALSKEEQREKPTTSAIETASTPPAKPGQEMEKPATSASTDGFKVGDEIECRYRDNRAYKRYYPGVIARVENSFFYDVNFDDGGKEDGVEVHFIRRAAGSFKVGEEPKKKKKKTPEFKIYQKKKWEEREPERARKYKHDNKGTAGPPDCGPIGECCFITLFFAPLICCGYMLGWGNKH